MALRTILRSQAELPALRQAQAELLALRQAKAELLALRQAKAELLALRLNSDYRYRTTTGSRITPLDSFSQCPASVSPFLPQQSTHLEQLTHRAEA